MAFPVYFDYDGGGSPPADFRADDLVITGLVSGTGVRFDYDRSEDCIELEELTLDGADNDFTYEIEGDEDIPYGDQGNPLFVIYVDARPGEEVMVDITSVEFTLVLTPPQSSPSCDLDEEADPAQIVDYDEEGPVAAESANCIDYDVELEFGTYTTNTEEIRVPLFFNHSHTSQLEISGFDFLIHVEDVHGNVLGVSYQGSQAPGTPAITFQVESSGQEYWVYGQMTNSEFDFDNGEDIGTLIIQRPTAANEEVDLNLSFEFGRIRNETNEECCQPDLHIDFPVVEGDHAPCSTSFPLTAQPTTQIPDDDDACLLYYDIVLSEEEIEVTRLFFQLQFELSGGATLEDFIYDEEIFPCSSLCPGFSDCISIINGNVLQFAVCNATTPIVIPAETTIRLVFEASTDGACIESATFINALIQQSGSGACVPEYHNSEEPVCLDRVSGTVKTELGDGVGEVEVVLVLAVQGQSCSNTSAFTGSFDECEGEFVICPDCTPEELTLIPEKDVDADCGVTTLDLVIIRKHILQIDFLDSPYRIIAADANKNKAVTTLDMVVIQKVILHLEDEFPGNSSWRFVDADYVFPDPDDPFFEDFPETVTLDRSTTPTHADFIGVKVGDVNISCLGCGEFNQETESETEVVFEIPDQSYQTDDTLFMAFSPDTNYSLAAFQLGLIFDPAYLEFLDAQTVDLDEIDTSSFNLEGASGGELRMVWVESAALNQGLTPADQLFRYRFIAKQAISDISLHVTLDDDLLLNVAYDTSGLRYPIELAFNSGLTGRSLSGHTASSGNFQFWPNPAENTLWIRFHLNQATPVRLHLSDLSGNVVWQREESCSPGTHVWKAPLDKLPPGIYFAALNQSVFRFVKN